MSKAKTAFDLQQQYNTATLCEQPRVYKPLRERLKAIDANSPEQIADLTARLAYHEGAECEYCGESLICTDESEYKGQQFPVACMECYGKQVERRVEAEAKLAASLGVLEETGKALELRAGQNPIPHERYNKYACGPVPVSLDCPHCGVRLNLKKYGTPRNYSKAMNDFSWHKPECLYVDAMQVLRKAQAALASMPPAPKRLHAIKAAAEDFEKMVTREGYDALTQHPLTELAPGKKRTFCKAAELVVLLKAVRGEVE